MMKKFSSMSREELEALLLVTNKLSDQMEASNFEGDGNTEADLDESERQAREYARSRNKGNGRTWHSNYGISDEDRSIIQSTRDWIERRMKQGRGPCNNK